MIDIKAVTLANLGSVWKILAGPATLIFIASGLSSTEQGIYFTFISIAAIQQVFELGFSVVLVQTYASSNSSLKYNCFSKKNEVKNLHVFSILVYFVLSIIFFIVAFFYGVYIFSDVINLYHNLKLYWGLYLLFIAISLLVIPFYSHMEGGFHVRNVYQSRLISAIFSSIVLWILLLLGYGLLSLVFSQATLILFQFITVRKFISQSLFCVNGIRETIMNGFHEFKKTFSFQAKLALVWGTGYLYWNSYNLIFFKLISPSYAGIFGMSFALFNAFSIIAQNIVLVNRARISESIVSIGAVRVNKSFSKINLLSVVVYVFCAIFLFLMFKVFPGFFIFQRILPINDLLLLGVIFLCTTIICNIATFTRCFGIEVLFNLSIVMNLIIPLFVYIYTKLLGVDYLLVYIALFHVIFLYFSFQLKNKFLFKERHY